jgi:hypothetical protein
MYNFKQSDTKTQTLNGETSNKYGKHTPLDTAINHGKHFIKKT